MIKFILCVFSIILVGFGTDVNAQSYSNTTSLYDGFISQQLFNIALVKDTFYDYDFIIFQKDTSYYMILFKDYTIDNNTLSANDTIIYRYFLIDTDNNSYDYERFTEESTTFTPNYGYISNLDLNKSSYSTIYQELLDRHYIVLFLCLMTGILFATFLTKGTGFYG